MSGLAAHPSGEVGGPRDDLPLHELQEVRGRVLGGRKAPDQADEGVGGELPLPMHHLLLEGAEEGAGGQGAVPARAGAGV